MVACLHLKMCRTSESPISEIGVALGTTDAHGLPLDFRSPFDISDLLRKTAEKVCGHHKRCFLSPYSFQLHMASASLAGTFVPVQILLNPYYEPGT